MQRKTFIRYLGAALGMAAFTPALTGCGGGTDGDAAPAADTGTVNSTRSGISWSSDSVNTPPATGMFSARTSAPSHDDTRTERPNGPRATSSEGPGLTLHQPSRTR